MREIGSLVTSRVKTVIYTIYICRFLVWKTNNNGKGQGLVKIMWLSGMSGYCVRSLNSQLGSTITLPGVSQVGAGEMFVLFSTPLEHIDFHIIDYWASTIWSLWHFFRGSPLSPHRLLFPVSSKGSFICTFPQTGQHISQPLMDQLWTTGWNGK